MPESKAAKAPRRKVHFTLTEEQYRRMRVVVAARGGGFDPYTRSIVTEHIDRDYNEVKRKMLIDQ
jgi:hypothetical protein